MTLSELYVNGNFTEIQKGMEKKESQRQCEEMHTGSY